MGTLSLKPRSSNRRTCGTSLAVITCLIVSVACLAAFGQAQTEPGDPDHIKVQAAEEPTPLPNYGAMTKAKDNTPPAVGEGVRKVLGIVYTRGETVDGEKDLLMDLYVPEGVQGKIPVLLWIHGGGFTQGTRNRLHIPWIVQDGYALATVEYRLAQEAKFPAQIYDCKAAVRWLRANAEKYNLDPDCIAVAGSSAGGHLVSLLGTSGGVKELEGEGGNPEQSSRVNAVLNFFGPTDFVARAKARAESGRPGHGRNSLLGASFEEAPEKYRLASPIAHVSSDDPPFLTTHGDSDPLIPFEQGLSLHKALKAAGVTSKLVEIVGGRHGVPPESYFEGDEARKRILAFLAENFKTTPQTPTSGCIKIDVSDEHVADGWKAYNIKRDPNVQWLRGIVYRKAEIFDATRELKLDLFLPKNVEGKRPVTVWIHGGGWFGGTRNNPQTPWVAKHGYAVASIEYRLSGQANFPAQIYDCKAAIRWLRANADTYSLDPDRICAIGGSAGGHLALLLGLTSGVDALEGDGDNLDQSSSVKTVVNLFGPTDLAAHARARLSSGRKDYENAAEKLIGASFAEAPEKYEAASPTAYITADDPPILTIHGAGDPIVPIEQARLLHKKLKDAGVKSTFYELVGAGHGEPRDPFYNSDEACSRVLTFLAENLKASPKKPAAETPRRRRRAGETTQEKLAKVADTRKDVVFKTVGDKELTMDFFVPKGQSKAKYPTVVFVHGGGWRSGTKNAIYAERFAGVVEMLINKGVMVTSIDYRLADGNSLYGDLIADCKDSIRWLRKNAAEYAIDTEEIGVWGPSAGGHLVLMMGLASDDQFAGDKNLAEYSAKVNFVISWYGTTDFKGQFESMKRRNGGPLPALLGGTPDKAPEAYAKASPVNYLTKDSIPILLCHGTNDQTVPFAQSQLLCDKAKGIAANVELLVVKGAGHNLRSRGQMEPTLEDVQKANVAYILRQFGP